MLPQDESPLKARHNESKAQTEAFALEWRVCEDETSWQETIAEPLAAPLPTSSLHRRLPQWVGRWGAPLLSFFAVVIGIGGWWIWHKAQIGLAEIEAEIQTVVVGESWLIASQSTKLDAESLQNWQAQIAGEAKQLHHLAETNELITKIQIVELEQDWARVQVTMELLNDPTVYRQTRVYQRSAQGWVRSAPTADRWGQPRHLETSYLSLHYFSHDEEAVKGIAEQLDRLYTDIYRIFHVNEPSSSGPNDQKVMLHIDPTRVSGELQNLTSSYGTIVVASPAATLAPASLAESELLAQSLMFALYGHFANQTSQQPELPSHGRTLHDGLRLWLFWDQESSLAIWREPLVKWVFWETVITESTKTAGFAPDLCKHHYLWMQSPLDIGIPVLCWQQSEPDLNILVLRYGYPNTQKVPLPSIVGTSMQLEEQSELTWKPLPLRWQLRQNSESTAEAVALATVIEYIATSFGRDRLPMLLTAFPEHQNWEVLIPTVLGLSRREFEDGWNDFLAERYGVAR